jgi:N6-adenosine-specific RNA methylase IME4
MGNNYQMEFHPYANIFPLIEGAEFEELVSDIRAHGVREPIWLYEEKILEGRNRYRASAAAEVDCPARPYEGSDPLAFVVSMNLRRRHLNESQRAMVAAKLANMAVGGREANSANLQNCSQADAASRLNVSTRTVASAAAVQSGAIPELQTAVERGNVSVSAAADVATLPEEQQREIVARGEREILEAARQIRARKAETRRQERIQNLVEISKGNAELGTDRKFPIIYADPPWRFENRMSDTRRIENHYPTMALEEICALEVAELSTPDAVLFIWSPASILDECIEVITAWGFEYKTCVVWVKDKIGMGFYVRNQHELLLIATRGSPPMPAEDDRASSVIHAPRTEHSEKPAEFYELIETMYPELPKIELFARAARDGWERWGNQAAA